MNKSNCLYFALLIITLLGGGLRFWQIGAQSLWLDEAFSFWLARQPCADMLRWIVQIDQHPPLYYLLLNGWLILGDDEATMRALSALFSTLTIPPIFILGRTLIDARTGLLAALLLAISPFHIWMAQEARMYALLAFNATWTMVALAHLLDGTPGRAWWAVYIIVMALTMLTHNTAVLLPLAVNAIMAGLFWARRAGDVRLTLPAWTSWTAAQLATLALWGVWLPAFIVQARGVYAEFWIPSPTWGWVAGVFKNLLLAFLPNQLGVGHMIWGIYAAAFGLGLYRLRQQPGALILLPGLFLLPFLGELLVSLKRPILYDRTLIWTTIPLYLWLAAGLTALKRRWSAFLLVLVVSLNIFSLSRYYTHFEKEGWNVAAAAVAAQARPGDLLLFNATWVQIPFEYYLDRLAPTLQVEKRGVPVDLFARGILEPKMTADDLPYLHTLIAGRSRVWLIYSHNWYTDPHGLILSTLGQQFARCSRNEFVGVQVYLCAQ